MCASSYLFISVKHYAAVMHIKGVDKMRRREGEPGDAGPEQREEWKNREAKKMKEKEGKNTWTGDENEGGKGKRERKRMKAKRKR